MTITSFHVCMIYILMTQLLIMCVDIPTDKVTVSLLAGNEMTITEGAPFSLEVSTVVPADGLECDVVVTVMTTDGSAGIINI